MYITALQYAFRAVGRVRIFLLDCNTIAREVRRCLKSERK